MTNRYRKQKLTREQLLLLQNTLKEVSEYIDTAYSFLKLADKLLSNITQEPYVSQFAPDQKLSDMLDELYLSIFTICYEDIPTAQNIIRDILNRIERGDKNGSPCRYI